MNKFKFIKFITGIFVAFIISSQSVFAAPWVNLKLTYDFSVHNYSAESVYIKINGNLLDNLSMPPIIMNNMTLVPAREVLEPLGAVVDWKDDTQELYIAYDDTIVVVKIGSKDVNKNGVISQMELAPKIINNKTMVPVRFISETLGFGVNWVNSERTIYITSPENILESATESISESTTLIQSTETTTAAEGEVEIENPFFKDSSSTETSTVTTTQTSTEAVSEALTEATTISIAMSNADVSAINFNGLDEIDFTDVFYYDRNMGNLAVEQSCVSNGVNGITQKADTSKKKHYFFFNTPEIKSINSGFFDVDDGKIGKIEVVNTTGSVSVCFNEETEVYYKIYECGSFIYFKPYI